MARETAPHTAPETTPETAPETAPATLVLLVRHGQTPTTGTVLPGRAPGLHLSEAGRAQAERVAERLAALPLSAVYSSPLERTLQTADPTAARAGLPVVPEEGLLECDVGDWTGARLAELYGLPEWTTVQRRPSEFRFPNGEGFTDLRDRMAATLALLRERHAGRVIACFSHADPIRVAVADAMGTPLDRFQRLSIGPCSVSALSYRDGQDPVVLTVNSTQEPLDRLVAS